MIQDRVRRGLVKRIEELEQAVTRLKAQLTWQPIATADKYGPPLRLYAKELLHEDFNPSGSVEGYWQDDQGWIGVVWCDEHDHWVAKVIFPTHWMHFPPPPAE